MGTEKLDGAESPVAQHVRKILAQLSALKARLRAQEHAQSGSREAVEVEREDDRPGGIDGTDRPA
jgi:outer membrane protein TolC